MTVRELKLLVAKLDDNAVVLTSGADVAQAVVREDPALILEMDPEYEHAGEVVWRDAGKKPH